jgi:hypothetical protein
MKKMSKKKGEKKKRKRKKKEKEKERKKKKNQDFNISNVKSSYQFLGDREDTTNYCSHQMRETGTPSGIRQISLSFGQSNLRRVLNGMGKTHQIHP